MTDRHAPYQYRRNTGLYKCKIIRQHNDGYDTPSLQTRLELSTKVAAVNVDVDVASLTTQPLRCVLDTRCVAWRVGLHRPRLDRGVGGPADALPACMPIPARARLDRWMDRICASRGRVGEEIELHYAIADVTKRYTRKFHTDG